MTKKENGFSAIEVVILIVVVLLLIGVGYIAYNQLTRKQSASSTTTSQSQASASTAVSADDLTTPNGVATEFYKEYVAAQQKDNVYEATQAVLAKYVTEEGRDNFISSQKACGLQNAPASVTVGDVREDRTSAYADGVERFTGYDVDVTYNFTSDSPMKFTLTIPAKEGVKERLYILGIRC